MQARVKFTPDQTKYSAKTKRYFEMLKVDINGTEEVIFGNQGEFVGKFFADQMIDVNQVNGKWKIVSPPSDVRSGAEGYALRTSDVPWDNTPTPKPPVVDVVDKHADTMVSCYSSIVEKFYFLYQSNIDPATTFEMETNGVAPPIEVMEDVVFNHLPKEEIVKMSVSLFIQSSPRR